MKSVRIHQHDSTALTTGPSMVLSLNYLVMETESQMEKERVPDI
jgi:hypothetical protein